MSRIVWESVLPWLVPRRLIDGVPAQSALVAEKLKSLLSHHEKYYTAMEAAAEAGATSCVDWLVSDRKRNATQQRAVADTMASSSAAGGCDDDDWDEERCVRRGNKEFIHVLGGLCCGGHLGMAMRLVDGRWPGITWQTDRSGGDSIAARAGLEQHVRDSAILVRVCRQGQLEVAKWMVERFNIREPWELARPFADALYKGQLRVAQWIVSAFNVIHTFESFDQWMCIHECACRSENLAVVKWCFETFPVHEPYTTESILFAVCTYAKRSSGADVLKFFIENFVIPTDEICPHSRFGRVDILKCVTSLSDSFNPSKEDLARYCKEKGGLELVKYAVEEYPLKLTAKEFTAACRNKLDDVGIMQWLSTKVTLSPKDLRDSLVAALAQNNTLIASWLDATFGIMRQLTSWNSTASSILVGVCKGMCAWKWKGRLEGVMWLVNHSEMRCVEESEVLEAIKELVSKESFPTVTLLLIEKFSIKEPHRTKLMASLLKISAQSCSLPTVKKVAAMGTFTKETVAQCLSGTCLLSSKTVKWLVTHFQLERAHIVLNKQILVNLLSLGKENCAEWLINRFHITLDEMLGNALKIYWERIDLFVWKMLIRKFPGLTSTFLKKMCLKLLLQSPVSVHFVRSFFPDISMNDIVDFCSHQTYFDFPLVTRYWLRSVAPQIWDKNSS
ncbi:hypothetical protein Pelo_16031 [Pelomyxa schiedti]|nr:hypothetical protein Pelo_16031 [Pelomyxa schiedti]